MLGTSRTTDRSSGSCKSHKPGVGKIPHKLLLSIMVVFFCTSFLTSNVMSVNWDWPYCNFQGTANDMTITYDLVFKYGAPYVKFTITNHAADRYNLFLIGNLYINGVKVPDDPDYRCIAEKATRDEPVITEIPISTGGNCILDPLVNSLEFRPLIKDGWPASGNVWISWETSSSHLTPCIPSGCPPSGQSVYLGESIVIPIHKVAASSNNPCTGGSIQLIGSPAGLLTYEWKNQNGVVVGTSKDVTIPNANPSQSGTYTLKGCTDVSCSCCGTATTDVIVKPTIVLTDPVSKTVCIGDTALFSVTASPTNTYNYQWQENSGSGWSNILGATSSSYTVTGTSANNGHQFKVLVSYDSQGSCQVESNAATLTVRTPITLSGPASQTVCDGAAATFSVIASPIGTYNYQWQEGSGSGWSNIPGATSSSYTVTGTSANNNHQFRVQVSYDSQGSCQKESNAALLTVRPPITLSGLASQTVCDGDTATFYVTASPTGTYNYQWQENSGSGWSNISGATSPSYIVTGTFANNGHQFRVLVSYSTSPYCQYDSIVAFLVVQARAIASAGPPQTICSDGTVALDGHASNYQTVTWSDGAGIFNPNANALNAHYTPTAAEEASGSVTLTLTATSIAPCSVSAISQMTITIEPRPDAKILVIEPVSVI